MAADIRHLPESEAERAEAQRRALGALLARITADRDALLGVVRECQQQVAALSARVDGTAAARSAGRLPPPADGGELDELKRLVEARYHEQQEAITRIGASADRAAARASDAVRRADALGEELCAAHEQLAGAAAAADAAPAAAAADIAPLRDAVEELRRASANQQRELQEAVAHLEGNAAAAETRAIEATQRLDALALDVRDARQRLEALPAPSAGDDGALADQRLEQFEGQLDQLCRTVERQQQEQQQRIGGISAEVAAAVSDAGGRADALARELGSLREEIVAVAQRLAATPAVSDAAFEQLHRDLAAIAGRLDAVEAERAEAGAIAALGRQVEEVHRYVQTLRHSQQDALAQLQATAQDARKRAEEACDRVAPLAARVEALADSAQTRLDGVARELAALGETQQAQRQRSDAALQEMMTTRAALEGRLQTALDEVRALALPQQAPPAADAAVTTHVHADLAAQIDAVGRQVERLLPVHEEMGLRLATGLQDARGGIDTALRRIETVDEAQRAAYQHFVTLVERVAAEREPLAATLQEWGEQLRTLTLRLDALPASPPAGQELMDTSVRRELDDYRGALERLQREVRQTLAQWDATAEHAVLRADEACRRVEEFVGTHAARERDEDVVALHTAHEHLTADLGIERIAPAAAPDEALAALSERIGRLESDLSALRELSAALPSGDRGAVSVAAGDGWAVGSLAAAEVQPESPAGRAAEATRAGRLRALVARWYGSGGAPARGAEAASLPRHVPSRRPAIAAAGLVVATLGVALAIGLQSLRVPRGPEAVSPQAATHTSRAVRDPARPQANGQTAPAADGDARRQADASVAAGRPATGAAAAPRSNAAGSPATQVQIASAVHETIRPHGFTTRLSVETSFAGTAVH